MRKLTLRVLATGALAASVLVGGCDTSPALSRADYEAAVVAAYDDVRRAFARTRVASPDVLAERVAAAQSALRVAADSLASLRPPDEAAKANRELVDAWRKYAQALDELRAAIRRRDSQFQQHFNDDVARHPAVVQAKHAVEELKERGFQLGMLAKD